MTHRRLGRDCSTIAWLQVGSVSPQPGATPPTVPGAQQRDRSHALMQIIQTPSYPLLGCNISTRAQSRAISRLYQKKSPQLSPTTSLGTFHSSNSSPDSRESSIRHQNDQPNTAELPNPIGNRHPNIPKKKTKSAKSAGRWRALHAIFCVISTALY